MKIKNILISQPKPEDIDKTPYGDIIKKYNVKIEFRKFFAIEGIAAKDFRKDKVNIPDFSCVIFNSKNAVDHYFRICNELRFQVPEMMKYFCISESVAFYLQKYIVFRKRKIFYAKTQTVEELVEIIKKHKTEKFLLPCSEVHKMELPNLLDENGIDYKKAIIYRTVNGDLKDIDVNKFDMLVFFSPHGIKSLVNNFPNYNKNIVIATWGEETAKAAEQYNVHVTIKAPNPNAPAMTQAIEQYLKCNSKK